MQHLTVLAVFFALAAGAAGLAQSPAPVTPFPCPAGAAGTDVVGPWRVYVKGPDGASADHRILTRYPAGELCGVQAPLEGLQLNGGAGIVPPKYPAIEAFSTLLAVARRSDGAQVFVDLPGGAERPFPYLRLGVFGSGLTYAVVSDDPATGTSRIVYLRPNGEVYATFDDIIGIIDMGQTTAALRQRKADGGEHLLWVSWADGQVLRQTPPVRQVRDRNNFTETFEVLASPFPATWPEIYFPLQRTGERLPLPPEVVGFAPHPLQGFDPLMSTKWVAIIRGQDGGHRIYTGDMPLFRTGYFRENMRIEGTASAWFEDMIALSPAVAPVAPYTAERYLVIRKRGIEGWQPADLEVPDPSFARPTPQAALNDAVIAYNSLIAAGGAGQANVQGAARLAAERASNEAFLAAQRVEEQRYLAIVARARTSPDVPLGDLQWGYTYAQNWGRSELMDLTPQAHGRWLGQQMAAEVRRTGGSVADAERMARNMSPDVLLGFAGANPLQDSQSAVLLCNSGYEGYCPPPAQSASSTSGSGGSGSGFDPAASVQGIIDRNNAVNASNCARASLGANIGCNR